MHLMRDGCPSMKSLGREGERSSLLVRPFTRPSIGRPVLPLSRLVATHTDLIKHSPLLWMLLVRNTQRDKGLLQVVNYVLFNICVSIF